VERLTNQYREELAITEGNKLFEIRN